MMEWALVLILAVGAAALGSGMLLAGRLLGPAPRRAPEKVGAYECGAEVFGNAREPFSVKYYLVAILFVLFDIETVFIIPWAVVYSEIGPAGLIEMFAFLGVLSYGLLYAWRKGALDWA